MFDKRNMTITRRAAASGPWQTVCGCPAPGAMHWTRPAQPAPSQQAAPAQRDQARTPTTGSSAPLAMLILPAASQPLSSTRSLHCLACKNKLKK